MVTIIIGGSGSGKSEYAEELIVPYEKECEGGLIYIATMQPYDTETMARIQKHRLMRQSKNFSTLECYTGLDQVGLAGHSAVLLECMSNLVANEMFSDKGAKVHTREAVLRGVEKLIHQADHLVVVTNNVFGAGSNYDPVTLEYLSILGEINRRLFRLADQVIEVIHGIPIFIKKAERNQLYEANLL